MNPESSADTHSVEPVEGSPTVPTSNNIGTASRSTSTSQHWVILVVACLMIFGSFFLRREGPDVVCLPVGSVPLPDVCAMRRMTGIGCPGCGLTRAFIEIARGQFAAAWHMNPASYLMFPLVLAQIPWQLVQIFRIRSGKSPIRFSINWLAFVLLACLMGQWIIRLAMSALAS